MVAGKLMQVPMPEDLVRVLLARRLNPSDWASKLNPWERLMEKPRWQFAKRLMEENAALVSYIVEVLVPLREFTTDPRCWLCLGKVRAHLEDWNGAAVAFERALEHPGPENVKAWYNLALVRQKQGRVDDAIVAATAAIDCSRNDERALALLEELRLTPAHPSPELPRATP